LHKVTRAGAALAIAAFLLAATAYARRPSVAVLDANARAAGNDRAAAVQIGKVLFRTEWPAEINQVSADAFDGHLIVGIRIWGVKFHRPMTRGEFVSEVTNAVQTAFAAAPKAEEVDLWASVPISVRKGAIVSGDLAVPTTRTVFSVTAWRGESARELTDRVLRGSGVFWSRDWEDSAFVREASRVP
jgi:hypothetical protein